MSRRLQERLATGKDDANPFAMAHHISRLAGALALLSSTAIMAQPTEIAAQPSEADIAAARDAALQDSVALDFTEALTTEIGPRLAGTPEQARSRAWAVQRLQALGFQNVQDQPFRMNTWVRGEEQASLIAPRVQNLHITALGNSGATPARGLEGDLVVFRSLAEFDAAPDSAIRGKIVYIGHNMHPTQDGSSYGAFGPVRFSGPGRAARRGAAGIIIRSVGTDNHRNPHAGNTNFPEGTRAIPAGAISNPDADIIEGLARRGQPLRLRLVLTPRNIGMQPSGNVVGEIPGSDANAGVITVACHLDSWDLGTGAIDDATGCGIITAAALRVKALGTPRRTIRVFFAGAEEVGGPSGDAYLEAHRNERHAATMESDFGADRVWRVDFKLPDSASAVADRITAALAPLGISRGRDAASGGADIEPLVAAGTPVIDLQQDGTRYFDIHHTPDDTFDKVDPKQLAQNVAAWTTTLAILANAPEALGEAR